MGYITEESTKTCKEIDEGEGNLEWAMERRMSTTDGPDMSCNKKAMVHCTDLPFLSFLLGREAQGRDVGTAPGNSRELQYSYQSQSAGL